MALRSLSAAALLITVRDFVRIRSEEAGLQTALDELDEVVKQVRMYGAHSTTEHAMPVNATVPKLGK